MASPAQHAYGDSLVSSVDHPVYNSRGENKIVATHFTDYGSVNFFTSPYPHFIFVNPKAQKKEIKCYLSTMKLLGNSLATAHSVSKNFIAQRDAEEAKGNNQSPEDFEKWMCVFRENLSKEEGMCLDHSNKENLYWKELTEPYGGSELKLKLVLMVNVYQRRTHIWLKPLWQDLKDPAKPWRPTLRGFQFTLKDDASDLVRWANSQMSEHYKTLKLKIEM